MTRADRSKPWHKHRPADPGLSLLAAPRDASDDDDTNDDEHETAEALALIALEDNLEPAPRKKYKEGTADQINRQKAKWME